MNISLKSLLAVFFLSSLLILSGCFGDDSVEEIDTIVETLEYETYEGIIQSLSGAKFNAEATHLLRLDDGSVIYVYSNFYDLDDDAYLNARVEVSGLLIPADDQVDKDVLAIESLEIVSATDDEAIDSVMTTYLNEDLGFSIDYRSDWDALEGSYFVFFTAPILNLEDTNEPDTITITQLSNNEGLEIKEWFLAYVPISDSITGDGYSESAVSMDQIPAIKMATQISEDELATSYYVDAGDATVFEITHLSIQPDYSLEYANLFSEMLYSFDLVSDGLREPAHEEVDTEEEDPTPTEDDDPTNHALGGTDYEETVEELGSVLNELIPDDEEWTPTRYDFVDPDYVYAEYVNASNEVGRLLVRDLGGGEFELLALFEEGSVTDWTLTWGTDEAKGKETTSFNVSTGQVSTIHEGYRSMESASLQFQMQYPSNWYYARSGNQYFFSTEPATVENALVTLSILEVPIDTYSEKTSGGQIIISVPLNDGSSFQLEASTDYSNEVTIMGQSLLSTAE